jgi:hypothetical protein
VYVFWGSDRCSPKVLGSETSGSTAAWALGNDTTGMQLGEGSAHRIGCHRSEHVPAPTGPSLDEFEVVRGVRDASIIGDLSEPE